MNYDVLKSMGINDINDLEKLSLCANLSITYLSEYYYDKYAELIILLQQCLNTESEEKKKYYFQELLKYQKKLNTFLIDFNNVCRDIMFNTLQSSNTYNKNYTDNNGVKVIEMNGGNFNLLMHAIRSCSNLSLDDIIIDNGTINMDNYICTSFINQNFIVGYYSDILLEYEPYSPFQIMNCLKGYTNFSFDRSKDTLRTMGFQTMIDNNSMYYGCEVDLDHSLPFHVTSLICFDQINDSAYQIAKMYNLPIKLIHLKEYPKALVKLRNCN